jgi:MarR family transcriptional regulator, organic hydroperoxide resistance regulator
MKPLDNIDFYIKATWHSIVRMYNKRAAKYGISQTIGYVLLNVNKKGSPATQIAPLLGMEPTSLSRLLKNMEQMGLIKREPDDTDKRIVRIFLTEKGLKKRKLAKNEVFAFNDKVRETIDNEKLSIFIEVMEEINCIAQKDIETQL